MNLASFFAGIFLSIASFFGGHATQPAVLGSVTPVGANSFFLSGAGITSTANTIQLTTFQTPDGRNITMSMLGSVGYAALEPGTSKLEDITFTGVTQNPNGTALLTGVTRGNDFVTPYAASSTLAKAHAGGSTLILTNTAGFYTQFLSVNNANTIYGVNTFSSTSPPRYDQPGAQAGGSYIATTSEFASVAYVNAIALSGVANATQSVKGILQNATGLQAASSTLLGSTGASLALTSGIASDTPGTVQASSASTVLISNLKGFLSQAWLDLSAAWAFTGSVTIPCSVAHTCTLNSLAYKFPNSQTASSTYLATDGSGNLSWIGAGERLLDASTTPTDMTTSSTTMYVYTVPANTIPANGGIHIRMSITPNLITSDNNQVDVAFGTATTSIAQTQSTGSSVSTEGFLDVYILNKGVTNSQNMTVQLNTMTTGQITTTPKTNTWATEANVSQDTTQTIKILIVGKTSGTSHWSPLFVTTELLQ